MNGATAGLRALLGRLVAHKVDFDNKDYNSPDHVEWDLTGADVISSQLKIGECRKADIPSDRYTTGYEMDLHVIVIDVDHPAHLVESSTPGHHHLYVEIPPVSAEAYFEWLEASAKIGLVEPGYVSAFKARGFTCVRLPWVQKVAGGCAGHADEVNGVKVTCKHCRPVYPVLTYQPSGGGHPAEVPVEDLRF